MAKKSNLPEVRIVDEIKESLASIAAQGVRCCILVAEYMDLFKHKTDKKRMLPELADDLGVSESRVHQWWRAGLVNRPLLTSTVVPANESQLRPLGPLLSRGDEIVQMAWQDAVKIADEAGEDLTAEHVQEAADRYKPVMQATNVEVSERFIVLAWVRRLKIVSDDMGLNQKFLPEAGVIEQIIEDLESKVA